MLKVVQLFIVIDVEIFRCNVFKRLKKITFGPSQPLRVPTLVGFGLIKIIFFYFCYLILKKHQKRSKKTFSSVRFG